MMSPSHGYGVLGLDPSSYRRAKARKLRGFTREGDGSRSVSIPSGTPGTSAIEIELPRLLRASRANVSRFVSAVPAAVPEPVTTPKLRGPPLWLTFSNHIPR